MLHYEKRMRLRFFRKKKGRATSEKSLPNALSGKVGREQLSGKVSQAFFRKKSRNRRQNGPAGKSKLELLQES